MLNQIDLSRADLNLLVLFEAVLEERHVGRAAERLNLSPSAVSHGLGRLRRLLNDPLFLKTPKGVVPTARATELAAPIADVLARVRSVISTAEPFDPATSTRRFTIGAPDGVSAVFLPPLLAELRETRARHRYQRASAASDAGGNLARARLAVRLRRPGGARDGHRDHSLRRHPGAFPERTLYEEDFVIAMRAGHPFASKPDPGTILRDAASGGLAQRRSYGFVDESLAKQGRSRRIALTVPNFMFALAVIAETDLISALPRPFVAMHARASASWAWMRRCRWIASGSTPSLPKSP